MTSSPKKIMWEKLDAVYFLFVHIHYNTAISSILCACDTSTVFARDVVLKNNQSSGYKPTWANHNTHVQVPGMTRLAEKETICVVSENRAQQKSKSPKQGPT